MSSILNSCSIGERIAKRHAQFYNVSSSLRSGYDNACALVSGRIAAHKIGNQYATSLFFGAFKGLCDAYGWLIYHMTMNRFHIFSPVVNQRFWDGERPIYLSGNFPLCMWSVILADR